MAEVLDYETPPTSKRRLFSGLTWAILASLAEHLFVFGFYSATLDGGVLARMSAVVSLCYWAVVLLIVARRRQRLTRVDLAFIAVGYPLMLFPSIYIVKGRL